MVFRQRVLSGLLLLFFTALPAAANYPNTPVGVVRFYCNFDLNTGRISSENFAKLPALVTWEEEPGWDGVTIVSGYKILSSKQSKGQAVVRVNWAILGHSIGEDVTVDEKAEIVEYRLRLVDAKWKIEKPILPPHVALFTLREFVQNHFQDDPDRKQLWLKNLDSMSRKLGATAYSMPPSVLQALAGDEKDYCDRFLGASTKGCVRSFRASLSWREMVVTPHGRKGILVENQKSCGSAGCALSLFIEQRDGKYGQILGPQGEVGSLDRIKVLKTATGGYYDIEKTWHDGKTRTLYQWNGDWYSSSSKP